MSEAEFLATYDPTAFPNVAITVDMVLLAVVDGHLCAVLQQRGEHPAKGKWALPGGFVGATESLDQAAIRVLAAKAHIEGVWLEQLYSFGDPDRDPRMRIITVAYLSLLTADQLAAAFAAQDPAIALCPLSIGWAGEEGGPVDALDSAGEPLTLAFDHGDILGHAVKRLRGKINYAPIAFSLLPPRFTLRALQEVHEAILGRTMAKPAFRRRMLDQDWIEATGTFEQGSAFRPAELYQLKPSKGE